MVIGLYCSGNSLLHQLSAGIKLSSLLIVATALIITPFWWVHMGMLLIVLLLWLLSQLGMRRLVQMGWMIPIFVILAVLANGYFSSWEQGIIMGTRILSLVILSMLVTYTTPLDEMTSSIIRLLYPIRWLGGNPTIIGFAISFCVRAIPMILTIMSDIREAQLARGYRTNALSLVVPLMIRLLRISTEIAESLDARGFHKNVKYDECID